MVNIKMEFRHPKYYKELRKRNKLDQLERAPGLGPKQQASSAKLTDPQATSDKRQAPRHKRQA